MIRFSRTGAFVQDTHGGGTVTALFFTFICILMTGLMIDGANAWRARAHLQIVADAASLAASQHLDNLPAARNFAVQVAEMNMPVATHGKVLEPDDIQFGYIDETTQEFVIDEDNVEAVQVVALRHQVRDNALPTSFLSPLGINDYNVVARSVASHGRTAPPIEVNICSGSYLYVGGVMRFRENGMVYDRRNWSDEDINCIYAGGGFEHLGYGQLAYNNPNAPMLITPDLSQNVWPTSHAYHMPPSYNAQSFFTPRITEETIEMPARGLYRDEIFWAYWDEVWPHVGEFNYVPGPIFSRNLTSDRAGEDSITFRVFYHDATAAPLVLRENVDFGAALPVSQRPQIRLVHGDVIIDRSNGSWGLMGMHIIATGNITFDDGPDMVKELNIRGTMIAALGDLTFIGSLDSFGGYQCDGIDYQIGNEYNTFILADHIEITRVDQPLGAYWGGMRFYMVDLLAESLTVHRFYATDVEGWRNRPITIGGARITLTGDMNLDAASFVTKEAQGCDATQFAAGVFQSPVDQFVAEDLLPRNYQALRR